MTRKLMFALAACAVVGSWAAKGMAEEGKKKVVFVAGKPSHGFFAHEHIAGCRLLASQLNEAKVGIEAIVVADNGYPNDPSVFDDAAAIVVYCDGGGGHLLNKALKDFDQVMKRGVGLVCIHYAVELPKGESGDRFLEWIGGYFEPNWSVNPHWTAKFAKLPEHPITRGVKPFAINDEWYYHMRFRPNMQGITPILTDLPGQETLSRRDGPHSGNPDVRAAVLERKEPQHVGWAYERGEDYKNGRGFGFTGGHNHINWGQDDFRRLVLNAIVWSAKVEVPADGVKLQSLNAEGLEANQDYPKPANWSSEKIQKQLEDWKIMPPIAEKK